MICKNCGMQNNEGSKFCVKCGHSLSAEGLQEASTYEELNLNPMKNEMHKTDNVTVAPVSQTELFLQKQQQQPQQNNNNINNNSSNEIPKPSKKVSIMQYFFVILAVILKPFTSLKEEAHKFDDFKNSAILSLIVSIIATLVTLIKTMITTVRVTGYLSTETKWVWKNLKNINYIQVIGKNFCIYLGIILAIACVYYIVSLIFKKQISFSRLFGISSLSVVPIYVCLLIVSPILSMIYVPLGMLATLVGGVYSVIMLYESMNNEIALEENAKYYFNLICLSILVFAFYYLYTKIIVTVNVKNVAGDLLDMLK